MIVVCWHRFGPYHHARARAAASEMKVIGLEISNIDRVNAWAAVQGSVGFEKTTLLYDQDVETISRGELRAVIGKAMSRLSPKVLVIHGYSSVSALLLLEWSLSHSCPAILMSESNEFDQRRVFFRERVKSEIIKSFSSALVGGTNAKNYLVKLGLSADRIKFGYDVVDNSHFSLCSATVQSGRPEIGGSFFLASGRFIKQKNFVVLVDAFAKYRSRVVQNGWKLLILGDGPLRNQIMQRIAELGMEGEIVLGGYKQYNELPNYYNAASCFVHPSASEAWGLVVNEAMAAGLPVLVSNRCGCAADLVREGVNGSTFDPADVDQLAQQMFEVAHDNLDREEMGRASQEIIANWGTERFANGLKKAVEVAMSAPPPSFGLLDKALLRALTQR